MCDADASAVLLLSSSLSSSIFINFACSRFLQFRLNRIPGCHRSTPRKLLHIELYVANLNSAGGDRNNITDRKSNMIRILGRKFFPLKNPSNLYVSV